MNEPNFEIEFANKHVFANRFSVRVCKYECDFLSLSCLQIKFYRESVRKCVSTSLQIRHFSFDMFANTQLNCSPCSANHRFCRLLLVTSVFKCVVTCLQTCHHTFANMSQHVCRHVPQSLRSNKKTQRLRSRQKLLGFRKRFNRGLRWG